MPYSDAQKKAIMKYKLKNRERINEQARVEYQRIKADPDRYCRRLDTVRRCNQRYRESQVAEQFDRLIRTYAREELGLVL